MVSEIIWSPLAIRTYGENIDYLEKSWTVKEVEKFIDSTAEKLKVLKRFPNTGYPSNQNRYLRKTLIGKRIILIYRYKPRKKSIELIRFFNTWQSPEALQKAP
jgi:plasmid stabilization system protein ParE